METLKLYWTNYKNIIIGGSLLIFSIVLWSYCSASSEFHLPEADKLGYQANSKMQESNVAINSADELANQALELEVPKQQAIKRAQTSRAKFERSNQSLQKAKKEYEEFIQTPVVIDSDNLNERERALLPELRQLYPDN